MADIDQMRQNHPELIVQDIKAKLGGDADTIRAILKNRGVNKWFAVRRMLIQLKDRWKLDIRYYQHTLHKIKKGQQTAEYKEILKMRGYLQCLEDCRQQVRALCHSSRDVEFPTWTHSWPEDSYLPTAFPQRPSKNWFRRRAVAKRREKEWKHIADEALHTVCTGKTDSIIAHCKEHGIPYVEHKPNEMVVHYPIPKKDRLKVEDYNGMPSVNDKGGVDGGA